MLGSSCICACALPGSGAWSSAPCASARTGASPLLERHRPWPPLWPSRPRGGTWSAPRRSVAASLFKGKTPRCIPTMMCIDARAGLRQRAIAPRRRSAAVSAAVGVLGRGGWAAALVPQAGGAAQSSQHFRQVIAESGLEDWKAKDYEAMRDDLPRTSSFEAAIKRRLAGIAGRAAVVDIGTGPFALLAVMAARAGARKVYAIEKNSEAAASARGAVTRLGLEAQVQVIEGDSMKIELPERVDLVVSELIGSIATQEGVEPVIRDAERRFLKEGLGCGGMIPERCQTCIAPVCWPGRSPWDKLIKPREGLRSRGKPAPGSVLPLRVKAADESKLVLLSEPQLLEEFIYCSAGDGALRSDERVLDFDIPKEPPGARCLFSGFAMWPRVVVDGQDVIDVRGQLDSHWAYVVALMSQNPIHVATPGKIQLKSHADYTRAPVYYTFDAEVPV